MAGNRTIRVFIASPGDLAVERRAFKEVIDDLNKGYGRGAHVTFEPLGWEDALSTVGRRSQSVINQDIDACDVFILVMWRRWGQEAPDAAPYSSYTEEEFYRALARFEKGKKPCIFVFFKHIDPAFMADPGDQLKKVLAFRRELENKKSVLYRAFDDESSFHHEVDKHLVAFAEGGIVVCDPDTWTPIIPDSIARERDKNRAELQKAVDELTKLRAEARAAQQEAEKARAEAKDAATRADAAEQLAEAKAATRSLTLAESAARAALDGKIEEARQDFAKALDGSTELRVLGLGFQFFERIGELEEAERLLRRWLSISGPDQPSEETAGAYNNIGTIEFSRGNVDLAEAYFRKSLSFGEELNNKMIIAMAYGNLGLIERIRGNLDAAEVYHKKGLLIDETLELGEAAACDYGNLGLVEQARGNLESAGAYFKKAAAIIDQLGLEEYGANQYSNLGGLEQVRGNLGAAQDYYEKALAINERLGRQEGIAIDCRNLGVVYELRGDFAGARAYWLRSRDLFARVGLKNKFKEVQAWINSLPKEPFSPAEKLPPVTP